MIRKALIAASATLLLSSGRVSAQIIPGAPPPEWDRQARQYTAETLRSYEALMEQWRSAWQNGDATAAAALYADEAFLFIGDQLIQGKGGIEAHFAKLLPNIVAIRTALSDFVASDRLAYALGPLWYETRESNGTIRKRTGTLMMVMVRDGRRWKIRSQLFRTASEDTTATEEP